jgi:hypothetical protein
VFFFQKMIINGRAFEGTCDYEITDRRLTMRTGTSNTSCIPTFRPVVFPHAELVYRLLLTLHRYQLCCFLTGTYALLVSGRLDSFDGITIFPAMTDFDVSPVLYWLFKKFEGFTGFTLDNDFQFSLLNADVEHSDLFH